MSASWRVWERCGSGGTLSNVCLRHMKRKPTGMMIGTTVE